MSVSEPSLYGIENSNRRGNDLWGKNQFNSTFPVALCCYMRDTGIAPVYIAVEPDFSHRTTDQEINISDVFGTDAKGDQVRFDFESSFEPAEVFTFDRLEAIDLVTSSRGGQPLRPLEIKLTVLPDDATASLAPNRWSSEIVVRPITTAYATIQIARGIKLAGLGPGIRKLIEPVWQNVQDWNNRSEVLTSMDEIVAALRNVTGSITDLQVPFLLQPIWKTQGKSPLLAMNCFDVFVWSDLAIWKLFIDAATRRKTKRVTRHQRECARTLRCLYELLTVGQIRYSDIYRGMDLGTQTDKAFSFGGKTTIKYMEHERLSTPAVHRDSLRSIILNSGETKLSPERRFDASVYFTLGRTTQSLG